MTEADDDESIFRYSLKDGEHALLTWQTTAVAMKLSKLDRDRIEFCAWAMCDDFMTSLHSVTGWCGDTHPDNHDALWPLFALMQVHQMHAWKVTMGHRDE